MEKLLRDFIKKGFARYLFCTALVVGMGIMPTHAQTETETDTSTDLDYFYEMSLEDLMSVEVTTASKKAEKIDLAPNIMYVFTKEQIQTRGYSDLNDIFTAVPGLAVFHKDIQLVGQVRGIAPNDNEKITIMINGHPINNIYEPDYFNGALRIEQFARIEVIVGPGSVLYGAQTLCATVNLITPQNDADNLDRSVNVTAGNFDNYSGGMSYESAGENGNHLFMSATYTQKGGWDAWPEDKNDEATQNLAGTTIPGQLHPSIVLLGNAKVDNWGIQFFSQNSQMAEEHQHKGAADDGRRYDYIYSMLGRNTYEFNDKMTNTFEVFGDMKRNIRTSVDVGEGHGMQQNWDIFGTVYGIEEAISHSTDKNYFQAGIQAHINQHRHNYEYLWYPDDPNRGIVSSDTTVNSYMRSIVKPTDTYNTGIYLSNEYRVSDQFKAIGALRFDHNTMLSDDDFYISPRLALVYSPSEKLIFKGMYNKATRMPPPIGTDLNTLWGRDKTGEAFAPGWATANWNAQLPEQLSAYEFQSIFYLSKFRFALNVYYQQLDDFFTWYNPRTNVGTFKGQGAELSVDAKLSQQLSIWGNYSYSENEFTSNPEVTPLVGADGTEQPKTSSNPEGESVGAPKHMFNVGTDINLNKSISVSLYGNGFAGQPMFDGTDWVYATGMYLNGAVNYRDIMDTGFDLRASCKNALNNQEEISTQWMQGSYMPRGLNFELSLAYRY